MAADAGLKDTLLTKIQQRIDDTRQLLQANRDAQKQAQLEDAAQALLTPADLAVLAAAQFTDRLDITALQQEEASLAALVGALQNLRQAVRGL